MKLLVLGDSHKHTKNMAAVLNMLKDDVSSVFFLGDNYEDINRFTDAYEHIEFYAVTGNCDLTLGNPDEGLVTIGGKKIFFCHGHKYGIKMNNYRIAEAAAEKGADICLYGHTHYPELTKVNGILLLNPGSIALPRQAKHTSYGIIDIDGDNLTASVVECLGYGVYRPRYTYP